MQLAVDDLAHAAYRQREFVVGHFDRRASALGIVEFLEQQIDEAVIHAARGDVADSDDDFLEAVGDRLLYKLVEFTESTRQVADARTIQNDRDEVGRGAAICKGNRPGEYHAHVDRADFAGTHVVQQHTAARHAGYIDANASAADQANRVAPIAHAKQVAFPKVLAVEGAHVLEQPIAQFRRSVAVKRVFRQNSVSDVLHACLLAPEPALACRA